MGLNAFRDHTGVWPKAKLRQPIGQRLSNVRKNKKKFNWANLILI